MKGALLLPVLAWLAFGQTKPPALLAEALHGLPRVTIIDPKIDLAGNELLRLTIKDGYLPPAWIEADFDRDGKPDVAAAVTESGKDGTRFGVLAVHSRDPKHVYWIDPLAKQLRFGVDFYTLNTNKGSIPNLERILPLSVQNQWSIGTWSIAWAEKDTRLGSSG